MAFAQTDYGTAATYASSGALNVAWHSGSAPADGLFLIMVVAHNNTSGSGVTAPSGWNTILNDNGSLNYVGGAVFWKQASGEPTSYNISLVGSPTGDHLAISMVSISGAYPGNSPQTAINTSNGTVVATLASPTITPFATGSLLLNCWINGAGDSGSTGYTLPTGYSLSVGTTDGTGNPWISAIQYCNTLTTLSTTASVTAGPNGTSALVYEDCVSFVIAPAATTVAINFTDTIATISDSIARTVTGVLNLTDTLSGINDTLHPGFSVNINFIDTLSISDILFTTSGQQLTSPNQNFFYMGDAAQTTNQVFFPFGPPVSGTDPAPPLN